MEINILIEQRLLYHINIPDQITYCYNFFFIHVLHALAKYMYEKIVLH